MAYSYTAQPPRAQQRDPSRSKERKQLDVSRRVARRTKHAVRSIWGF